MTYHGTADMLHISYMDTILALTVTNCTYRTAKWNHACAIHDLSTTETPNSLLPLFSWSRWSLARGSHIILFHTPDMFLTPVQKPNWRAKFNRQHNPHTKLHSTSTHQSLVRWTLGNCHYPGLQRAN